MKTELAVSCPECGKETVVTMEMRDGLLPGFENILSFIVKRYTFDGSTQCACGKLVIVTLTVTGGGSE